MAWHVRVANVLAWVGWSYWLVLFIAFFNFVSWMLSAAFFLTVPTMLESLQVRGAARKAHFERRWIASGILVGVVVIAAFSNVARVPQQVYRHYRPYETMFTPGDPQVLQLLSEFNEEFPPATFQQLTFDEQMYQVDKFIYRKIAWVGDYTQYGMVGLLVTAHETIERRAGDCQGQSVTTANLLQALGFEAWMVETPWHWWTHARDNVTGLEKSLNFHGGGGLDGTVLPQPIDLVYTRYPPRCTNCSDLYAYNQENLAYASPPWTSFANAWTASHILVRNFVPSINEKPMLLFEYGLILAVLATFYGTYVQDDFDLWSDASRKRLIVRFTFSAFIAIYVVTFGIYFWAVVHYPFSLLHALGTLSLLTYFIASNYFNKRIGTPQAIAACHL